MVFGVYGTHKTFIFSIISHMTYVYTLTFLSLLLARHTHTHTHTLLQWTALTAELIC